MFVAISFAISWGTLGLYIFHPDQAAAWFGEISGSHPAFFLATWGPAIAAFLVVFFSAGLSGVKRYLSRLLLWRCSWSWALLLLIGVPLVFVAGALVKGGPLLAPLPEGGIGAVVGVLVFMLFLGPIEELGWRGVAQPLLQRHMAPIWAGFIIGATWGIWHLPAFYLSGTVQSTWAFWPFFFGSIALAVIVTPLFNASHGSILLAMLFHWQLINPLWPDAQPYDIYFFILVALAVVWLNRSTMFSRECAVTEVVPGSGAGRIRCEDRTSQRQT